MEVWDLRKPWVLFLDSPPKSSSIRLALDELAGYFILVDFCMLLSDSLWIRMILLESTLVCV